MLVIGVLILVQTIFSLWPVLIKLLLKAGVSAVLLGLIRDIIASILLWLGVWIESGYPGGSRIYNSVRILPTKVFFSVDSFEKSLFLLLGVASSINSISYVLALHYVTPFNSALLHPTIPVFAGILGSLLGVEKMTPRKILGACICIAGSLVVVASQADMHVSLSLYGNILLVVQSFAMASLLVGQKFVPQRHSALKTTAIYYTIGTAISSPICLALVVMTKSFMVIKFLPGLVICFGAVFVVAFNYAALTWANKASSPAVAASSMMLQPPFTYILGYLLGSRQQVGWWEVGGGCVIICGLFLTTLSIGNSSHDLKAEIFNLQDDDDDEDVGEESRLLVGVDSGVGTGVNSAGGRLYGYGYGDSFSVPPLTKRSLSASPSTLLGTAMSSPSSSNSSLASSRSSSPGMSGEELLQFVSKM